MFDNLLISPDQKATKSWDISGELSFNDYIANTQALILSRRTFPKEFENIQQTVLEANSPYDLKPNLQPGAKCKYGALLIHGLLDCPFSLRGIGEQFREKQILARSILLPGHGTRPSDLNEVSYLDWIEMVNYGINSIEKDAEKIFLVGYSTGAALSIYHALNEKNRDKIAGLILLAPAIRINGPVNIVVAWHYLLERLKQTNPRWLYRDKEIDYAKYRSITFNAVTQVAKLTDIINQLYLKQALNIPILMVMSDNDETISSQKAKDFFCSLTHKQCKLLLYSANRKKQNNKRIEVRNSYYPELYIKNFSHVSVPFAPDNKHYGQHGDYEHASLLSHKHCIYGAYNPIEEKIFRRLHQLKLVQYKRRELTYNPDFDYMTDQLIDFIKNCK